MNCPLCVDEVLDVTHHHGIEIDVCPRCRGLWLDRGELDRLLGSPDDEPDDVVFERPASQRPTRAGVPDGGDERHDDHDDDDDRSRARQPKSKRRRLIDKLGDALEEVLDI